MVSTSKQEGIFGIDNRVKNKNMRSVKRDVVSEGSTKLKGTVRITCNNEIAITK